MKVYFQVGCMQNNSHIKHKVLCGREPVFVPFSFLTLNTKQNTTETRVKTMVKLSRHVMGQQPDATDQSMMLQVKYRPVYDAAG